MSAVTPMPPADFAERRAALHPARSFIVQAPAGSGKTELLIQRFLTLLARVDQPESVLAITFTRKAAGEMRARVLDALRGAAEEPEPAAPNDKLTWRLAQAVLEQDAHRTWNIRSTPARLRIETIDALCLEIARRMPWLSRFGSMPDIVEDARELYAEAARQTLLLLADPGYSSAVEKLALHVDNDLARAQHLLVEMLARRDQWLRHIGTGAAGPELRATLEATLASVVDTSLARLREVFPLELAGELALSARFAARNLDAGHPLANLDALPEDLAGWQALAHMLLIDSGDWRKQVTVKQGFPADRKPQKQDFLRLIGRLARVPDLLDRLLDLRDLPAPRYTGEQWEFLEALLALLPAAAAQLKIVFQQRGLVDFAELAQAAQRALGPPERATDLALALGCRIEHILVDEVQDTSVTQIRMIESLIAAWDPGDGRTLFLVGDPMQSIYKFREAEVGLFLKIRREGLRGVAPEPLTLRVNFRSRSDVVEWVNESLAGTFPGEENVLTGAVPYSPSVAFRGPADSDAVRVHPFLDEQPAEEARLVADLVEEAERDFPGGRTAILVRARAHLTRIVAELQSRGIPFRAVEIDLLAERPVIGDLVALTRALLHAADRAAWLAILRAPWCGLTLAELYAIAGPDRDAPVWDLLAANTPPRARRFCEVMSRALARIRREPLRTCVEQAWIELGGPSCVTSLADAQRFFGLLEDLDQGGEIPDLDRLHTRVTELYAEPDPAASSALQVMTIHKAKGLEFDVVIVPGLGYGPGKDPEPLLRWAEVPVGDGDPQLLFAPVESAEDQKDPTYGYLRKLDHRKSEQETARLLYVATTRARERLHLLGHVNVKDDDGELSLSPPRSGSLLKRLWPAVEPEFERLLAEYKPALQENVPRKERLLKRLPEGWQPPVPPAPLPWRAAMPEQAAPDEPVSFDWVGDTLRHVGTVVHAMLSAHAVQPEQRGAIRTALASLGVPPSEIESATDRVETALRRTLGDPRGQWILANREIEARELALSTVIGGAVRHWVVDRTFVDEDGTRWVIDYKTSTHEGGHLEEFLDNERQRYRAQLESYARLFAQMESRPIRCGLYFPLLGGWREWAP